MSMTLDRMNEALERINKRRAHNDRVGLVLWGDGSGSIRLAAEIGGQPGNALYQWSDPAQGEKILAKVVSPTKKQATSALDYLVCSCDMNSNDANRVQILRRYIEAQEADE